MSVIANGWKMVPLSSRLLEIIQCVAFAQLILLIVLLAIADAYVHVLVVGSLATIVSFLSVVAITMWHNNILFTFRWVRSEWAWTQQVTMREVVGFYSAYITSVTATCILALTTTTKPIIVAFACMVYIVHILQCVCVTRIANANTTRYISDKSSDEDTQSDDRIIMTTNPDD